MKNTMIFVALSLVIGFAVGWLAKPAKETPQDDNVRVIAARTPSRSADPSSAPRQARPAQRSGVTARKASPGGAMDPGTVELMREESRKRENKMMRKIYAGKFDARIVAIVKELGLSAVQEKALRTFFDGQLEKIDMSAAETVSPGNVDSEELKRTVAAMRGDGLNEFMKDHLTGVQMEALETFQERQRNNKIESHALKGYARLQDLNLSDDQRDKVYNLLVEDAEKRLASQSDLDFLSRSMMSGIGVEADLGDIDIGSVIGHAEGGGSEAHGAWLKRRDELRKKMIDMKVARLAPVLNEAQQQQYRKILEDKGRAFMLPFGSMVPRGDATRKGEAGTE